MCWGSDPATATGTCVTFCQCSPSAPKCGVDTEAMCTISNNGVLPLCLPMCDPLAAQCPGGDVCIPATGGEGFLCVLDASGGQGTTGAPCNYANSCNSGNICSAPTLVSGCTGVGCCTALCNVTDSDPCPSGGDCTAYYDASMAPPCYEDVGICVTT